MKKLLRVNNAQDTENKITSKFSVEVNSIQDKGEGVVMFSKPVTITDTSEQWNGTKYDLDTFDISGWNLLLTADHSSSIQKVLGKVIGLEKVGSKKVTISGIDFAVKENSLALFAYNMMLAGYLTDFSIETIGPWPDDDRIYHDSKLVGCSVVVAGNNKQAHVNEIAMQSMEKAKENGLDIHSIEEFVNLPIDNKNIIIDNNNQSMYKTIVNSKPFAVSLKFKNAAGNEIEITLAPGQSVDVSADQEAALNAVIANAVEPKKEEPKTQSVDVAEIVKNAVAPLVAKITELEQKTFDNSASEPQFTRVNTAVINSELAALDYHELHGKQINLAWDYLKSGNDAAGKKLNEINKFNMESLKKAGKVKNSVTISDFGNFVISPELLTEIEGFRSNFKTLLDKVPFKDTLSLQMAWLNRSGDINMQEVEMCDDGADGNLKPVSEYEATLSTSNLHELAAVTPVCNAATRFLAADLLGDVAQGYRTDFDRKKAQLFVARMQQAVNSSGLTKVYATTSDVNALKSFMDVGAAMQQDIMGGVFILSQASYWEMMKRQMGAGIGNVDGFKIFTTGDAGPLLLGSPYIVVPNELLPTLNTAETRVFVIEGSNVTITQAVFYVDVSTFSGRTSGGLRYDLSTEAAYEVSSVVKSAFQRNELVLRGSFFRGGAIRDEDKVVGLASPGVS